ncbi:MAG: chemotaxis protein CheW [Desulforhabdus sp.]|nr:chemotaxis protein CheW [Desulforhabdus sp.]
MMIERTKYGPGCWKVVGTSGDSSCPQLPVRGHCRNCSEYAAAGRGLFDRDIPDDYQLQWTEVIARNKEREPTDFISVVVFRLRREWLALKTVYFQEIGENREVHSVPHRTNKIFRGLVNIGGELLLCVSAADVLGLGEEMGAQVDQSNYRRMAVIRHAGRRFVFAVEEVLGVYRFAPIDLQKTPATVSGAAVAFTKGIFNLEDKTIGVLDEEAFLSALSLTF